MLCIRSEQLDKIETALKAYDAAIVNVRPIGCMQQALETCAEVRKIIASDEQRAAAEEIFCKGWGPFADEIEIDDEASVSEADDGYWVSAWVWVPKPKVEVDWDRPVQWSTGEEITFAPYDDSMPNHHVSACAEWTKVTGDSFVAVDDDGLIMGCEDELYPTVVNVKCDIHTDTGRGVCADCQEPIEGSPYA